MFNTARYILIILIFTIFLGCKKSETNPNPPDPPNPPEVDSMFYTGMDLSYQPFLEDYALDYKDANGNSVGNLLTFVKNNGVNLIRIRLFHTPDPGDAIVYSSNLDEVIKYCKQIKQSGNNIMLDIHYADTWADPGHQTIPAAWDGLNFDALNDSVYNYTKFVLNKLKSENALPKIVQIGNETNSGFLWDHGKVWNEFNDNWPNYVALINSASKAISEVANESGEKIKSMVHVAGVLQASGFFTKLKENGAQYDMIGLSHYHNFHSKDLIAVQNSLNYLANTFHKPIMIVETQYPFTLGWNDWTHNVVGLEEHLITGYPATPEGQKAYFENLIEMMKKVPDRLGVGFIWWAPDLVAFDGPQSANGSSRENLCVFDFDNKALPVFKVFNEK